MHSQRGQDATSRFLRILVLMNNLDLFEQPEWDLGNYAASKFIGLDLMVVVSNKKTKTHTTPHEKPVVFIC